MVFNPDFFTSGTEAQEVNRLLKYLQHQSPDVLARIAKSVSPEIKDIISRNVQGLVGVLACRWVRCANFHRSRKYGGDVSIGNDDGVFPASDGTADGTR